MQIIKAINLLYFEGTVSISLNNFAGNCISIFWCFPLQCWLWWLSTEFSANFLSIFCKEGNKILLHHELQLNFCKHPAPWHCTCCNYFAMLQLSLLNPWFSQIFGSCLQIFFVSDLETSIYLWKWAHFKILFMKIAPVIVRMWSCIPNYYDYEISLSLKHSSLQPNRCFSVGRFIFEHSIHQRCIKHWKMATPNKKAQTKPAN